MKVVAKLSLAIGVLSFTFWCVYAYRFGTTPFVLNLENLPGYGVTLKRLLWVSISIFLLIIGASLAICSGRRSRALLALCFTLNASAIVVMAWLWLRALGIWYALYGTDETFNLF